MDFSKNQNPMEQPKHNVSEGEKIVFLAILVAAVVVVGWFWEAWRTGPTAPRPVATETTQSVLSSLTATNLHPAALPQSVLNSLTAANPHPAAPPRGVLNSLTAK